MANHSAGQGRNVDGRALDLVVERGMAPGEALYLATLDAADDEIDTLRDRAVVLGWDADTRADGLPVDEARIEVVRTFVEELDAARLFLLEDGPEQHTSTLGELRNANDEDAAVLEWLDTAEIGDVFGGFNSLRVERIR